MSQLQLTARNASPADLVAILNSQQASKLDVVAPATAIRSIGGQVSVDGTAAEMTGSGVTSAAGLYTPTLVFDDGLSKKLGIPRDYMRKMRDWRPDLVDRNVNGWLHGLPEPTLDPEFWPGNNVYPPDDRSFLLRLFRDDGSGTGVARALLSNSYALSMDNLDILTAVMRGVQATGLSTVCRTSDLSERRMRVRIECPDINVQAPGLAEGYRSPFDGGGGATRAGMASLEELRARYGNHHLFDDMTAPIAFIGFDLVNSETGGGAYTLVPVVVLLKCTNGMKVNREGMRKVHLGSKLAEGVVRPSLDTLRKAGELITAETRDTVQAWLTQDYLGQLVAGLEEKAARPIASPSTTVPAVCAGLGFTDDETRSVLDLFIAGGQPTAGGIMQAVSAYAQTVEDPDRAYDIEDKAVTAMEEAAK